MYIHMYVHMYIFIFIECIFMTLANILFILPTGAQEEVNLIPNGKNIPVTSKNKHRYVQCVAKYYLHDRLQKQAAAFFHGLHSVIQPEMLGMFCAPELQILISGAVTGISVEELRHHCCYSGGYHVMDSRIQWFWQTMKGFTLSFAH